MKAAAGAVHASHHRWDQIPLETLKGTITRRFVSTERMMIAHVYFKQGDDVPRQDWLTGSDAYLRA